MLKFSEDQDIRLLDMADGILTSSDQCDSAYPSQDGRDGYVSSAEQLIPKVDSKIASGAADHA